MSRSTLLLPIALLVIAMTSIQSGASLAKSLFPLIGPEGTTALRLSLAALILCVVMRPWRTRPNFAAWRSLLGYGLSLGAMNLLFYMALRTIPFGIAVAIEFTGPLAVAMLASRRGIDFVWVGCAVGGLLLLLPLNGGPALDLAGVLYALGAAACWALYIVFGKRAGHLHAGHSVSLGLLAASLVVVPVGVAHAGMALLEPKILLAGFVVAVVSSAIPISLEMVALKRLPKETFGILISMEPAVTALWALLLLHERLGGLQWLAIGCTVLASVGSTMTARGRRPAS